MKKVVGRIRLKGKTEPTSALEPVTDETAMTERLDRYAAAYKLLEIRSAGAIAAFRELVSECPDDPLVRFHLQRLEAGYVGDVISQNELSEIAGVSKT